MTERIFITGPAGSGKSTYAKKLAKENRIKYFQLDHIRYPNGGSSPRIPDEQFKKEIEKIVSKDNWIIEGTLKGTQDIIFPRCTKIIVLEASRIKCTYRTIIRTIKRVMGLEDSYFNELRKLFTKDFVVFYIWRHYPRFVRQINEALENTDYEAEVIKKKV